jgi:hypothetical protein
MNSSGIKRTMAAFAISAVAVAGIPALAGTAFADSVNNQVNTALGPDEVVLYNSNFEVSTKGDGSIRLEAGGGTNVQAVRFEYQNLLIGSSYNTIGDVTTRNDDGSFALDWTTPPVGASIQIRVRDITPLAAAPDTDEAIGVEVFGNAEPNVETINIADDTNRGYYDATTGPFCNNGINLIVNGTTSVQSTAANDAPRLEWLDASGPYGTRGDFDPMDTTFADITSPAGSWSGYLDLEGTYNFADVAGEFPDQIVTRAQTDVNSAPTRETEDIEAFTLYEQTITTVTVSDDNNGNGGLPTSVTVHVADQNGEPIAGAQVEQSGTSNTATTDSAGNASFDQFTNLETYYADQDCNGTYQFGAGDRTAAPFQAGNSSSSISIVSNAEGTRPVPSSTRETVTVRDAAGNPIVNRQVRVTRNGPDSTNRVDFFTTNAQGQVLFSVTCNVAGTIDVEAAFQDPSGSGTPLPSDPFNRKATDTVQCSNATVNPPAGGKAAINPAIKGKNVRGGDDLVTVRAKQADGAHVKIFKIVGQNRRVLVDEGTLNDRGVYKTTINDTNGADITAYKAVVGATADTVRGATNRLQQQRTR